MKKAHEVEPVYFDCGCVELPGKFKSYCEAHAQLREVRRFRCMVYRKGWWEWALGIAIGVSEPNIEIHLPVVFFKFGWFRELEEIVEDQKEVAR